jgi:signal transduction histidine kinase/tetratricopeptide (TPR) repeat protein
MFVDVRYPPLKNIDTRYEMIALFKRNRTSRLRFIRAYLLIILVCTLLLFCFSIISLFDQRQRVKELSSWNLELIGKQMAMDLEKNRMDILAADCLSKQNMKRLAYMHGGADSLENLRTFREFFERLKEVHPIAQHFFVFKGSQLLFPRISSPPPQSLRSLSPATPPQTFRMFLGLLQEGEHREIQLARPVEAAQAYRSAERLDVGARLKALALFRTARALQKANLQTAALEAYQTLLKLYGDQYDEFETPYILTLATAPEELTQRIFPSSPQSLYAIYQDLMNGKWELSADQTEHYMSRLEQRLKLNAPSHDSDFLDHFQAARAVSRQLAVGRQRAPFEIIPQAFEYEKELYQIYCTSILDDNGREFVVGFTVSIPWIRDSLVPTLAEDPNYSNIGTVSLVKSTKPRDEETSDQDIYVQFKNILPFWKLHISAEVMHLNEMAASRELWFVSLSAFMFLCILGIGLFLFVRVSFHIRWDQLRSDFVSGVSHEFKTPLSLIRLYSETLANNYQDYSPEDRSNYIRIIARESERMSRLIDNVLDFSKMEQGSNSHALQEGDLTSAVSQAVSDYSDYLTWRGFSVKTSIWPQLPPVRFNREQVSQMVLNLLDNARKYSGTSKLIRVNVWAQESEVVVEVQDNGPGIAAEEIEKIFQPFYRIPKGNEKGGCGLGLYLVDQVMKEHGGRVEVESTVNQGSSFRLIFPASGMERSLSGKQGGHTFTKTRCDQQVQDFS